jgi:hypothetical protein
LEVFIVLTYKVLIGPIATDREYHAGENIVLSKADGDVLLGQVIPSEVTGKK